jgi:hypothetical protein
VQGESWLKDQDSIMLNASTKRESLNKFDINKPIILRELRKHKLHIYKKIMLINFRIRSVCFKQLALQPIVCSFEGVELETLFDFKHMKRVFLYLRISLSYPCFSYVSEYLLCYMCSSFIYIKSYLSVNLRIK